MSSGDFTIPRVIYSLWLQGEKNAPEVVRLAFQRWGTLNPDYAVRILDQEDVNKLLGASKIATERLTVQALSDVVRAKLLLEGGVWVDASVFPVEPLSKWLPLLMQKSQFYAFAQPAPDRPLSTWFLAAAKNNILMRKWWDEVERYWQRPRALGRYHRITHPRGIIPRDPVWEVSPTGGALKGKFPYFWFHYLFRYLLETDADFASCWEHCAKLPANQAFQLQALLKSLKPPTRQTIFCVAHSFPLHKLNWRDNYSTKVLETL